MRVLLDTNILVRISNGVEPDISTALESLNHLRSADHEPTLVPQNLYEFWTVATRPTDVNGLGLSVAEADAELARYAPPFFRLLQDERAIFRQWKELVVAYNIQGKVAHDARLVAAMLRHGLVHLLTFNAAHFARFQEVTVHTPETVLAGALDTG